MQRLTKQNIDRSEGLAVRQYNHDDFQEIVKRLAFYEALEENGLLLTLPCSIGTPVYAIDGECEGDPYDCYHSCESCGCHSRFVSEVKFDLDWLSLVGKTVFLIKEEAEEALQRIKGV